MATIRKRSWKNDKGAAGIAWAVDFTDYSGNRQRKQFSSRKEAEAFRIEIEGQLHKGSYRVEGAQASLEKAAGLFLEYCEGRMRRGERMTLKMFRVYEGHVRNYICPDAERHAHSQKFKRTRFFQFGLGRLRLDQISARVVGDFRDHLRDAGLSVASTRHILGTLKLILSYAVGRDLIAHNVAQGVRVIARRSDQARKVLPPTKEAMRQLLDVAEGDFRVTLLFAAMTGVRASELRALRWRHIDFAKAQVKIETRVDAYGQEDVTKTAAGMRTIPLGSNVVRALQTLRQRENWTGADDLVFPNKRGRYENHDNLIKRGFAPLFAKLARLHAEDPQRHPEPPPKFNWHALRHFAISC